MSRLFIVEQNALGVGGHYFAYTACVAHAAIDAGLEAVILQNSRQRTNWDIPGAVVFSAFTRTWSEADRAGNTGWGPGDLVYELLAATSSAPPTAGDHVLFHTLGQVELRSVLSYLSKMPPSDHIPTFHLLLRYDPNELGPTLIALEPVLARIRAALHLRRAVRFHTDTDQLTSVYARMSRLPFSTLPIPFAQATLRRLIAEEAPRADDAPITFVYLGDARHEKNFHHIPAAIGQIWDRFVRTGKARFVLQSNFNTEGGEVGQLAAVQRLGQFSQDRVRLIPMPMDQADYHATLNAADVVLVPYSAQRYRERSSGVLVEAMAAGKPVITSSGSWMETFVTPDHAVLFTDPAELGDAFAEMILNFDRYRAGALSIRDAMLDWSSGANFVRELLKAQAPVPNDQRPSALVIMNGDAMVLQNGSAQIARSQFEYLSDAGFRVTGLFLTRQRRATNDEIEAFTEALLGCTSTLPMDECHIAAPGRLAADILAQSVARSNEEPSVEADLSFGNFYDYNATTLRALRRHRPDVIILNYVTNIGVIDALDLEDVPLICEMHDIQSFQKAIYGRRAVSARDLEIEMEMLARCDYLISLNAAETRLIEERLPAVPCRTSGVFSTVKPPTYTDLAGCKDMAELISSTGPRLRTLRYDDSWAAGDLEALKHRLDFPRIDILFVSSNHLANVSGLRWFLDEVYAPYLAPVGVRMLVAGSVFHHGEWPKFDGLIFTGQVNDLAPLYAAARVVVLPITEGAGSAVKTFEAMRYMRPIVATPLALRGITEVLEGVLVASEPAAFAEQVLTLLRSPERRADCRNLIATSARKLIDPARYRAVMNEAIAHLLGPTAPTVSTEDTVSPKPTDVEWDAETIALNRLIRDLLDDEEPGWAQLRLLSALEPERLRQRLDEIVRALLIDQDAPILRTEARVRNRIQLMHTRFPNLPAYIAPLLCRAAGYASPRRIMAGGGYGVGMAFTLFHHRDHAVRLMTITDGEIADVALDGEQVAPAEMRGTGDHRVTAFTLPPVAGTPYDFAARDIRVDAGAGPPAAMIASTTIRIDDAIETFGAALVPDQRSRSLLFLSAGRARNLNLPRLGGIPRSVLVVDLFFKGDLGIDATLSASYFGIDVAPVMATAEGRMVRRIVLDNVSERAPFGPLPLSLRLANAIEDGEGIAVEKVRLSLVAAPDPAEALAAVEEIFAPPVALTDGGIPASGVARLRELLIQTVAARPLPLNGARVLREIAHLPNGHEALHDAVGTLARAMYSPDGAGVRRLEQLVDTVLFPAQAVAGHALAFVASPSIDIACSAMLEHGQRNPVCRIDGIPLSAGRDGPAGATQWYSAPVPAGPNWLREIEWRDAAGSPIIPARTRVLASFTASLATKLGEEQVVANNLYGLETGADGQTFRWTGPSTITSFLLPLAITASGELRMTIVTLGDNQPDDISIVINGRPAPTVVNPGSEGVYSVIRAALTPQDAPATTLVELVANRLFYPITADMRRLGIAFATIEIELALGGDAADPADHADAIGQPAPSLH